MQREIKRTVILHEDDVGMCHGANVAFFELTKVGTCSSGSVMVPCPWYLEAAEAAAVDPTVDLGIHLTINAEKRFYKWRPLTAPSQSAGLTDDNGHFWPDVATTRRKAHPDAVEAEFRAQIEAAYRAGIDVTHLDGHMGAAISPEFCAITVHLAHEYKLPLLLTRTVAEYGPNDNLIGVSEDQHRPGVDLARELGLVIFDRAVQTTWDRPRGAPAEPAYRNIIEGIPPGLTFFSLHQNTLDELIFIEPERAYIRAEEYALFKSEGFRGWLFDQGLNIVGFRPMRDELRARLG
jgi:predicted glycoside hydrolase/deacetylase ChbG (UPF0249 family)